MKILKNQPRIFSWSSLWANIKLCYYRWWKWQFDPPSKYMSDRDVVRAWGAAMGDRTLEHYYDIPDGWEPKDMTGVTHEEYFPKKDIWLEFEKKGRE